jgi:predicted nucleic-acid-binding protein
MRAVDTNVLVRLMTRDDARQVAPRASGTDSVTSFAVSPGTRRTH